MCCPNYVGYDLCLQLVYNHVLKYKVKTTDYHHCDQDDRMDIWIFGDTGFIKNKDKTPMILGFEIDFE